MKPMTDPFNTNLKIGDSIAGYQIIRVEHLKLIHAFFYELTHLTTGARHVHVSRDDNENTFGVAFKTVPKDSTGVAHILEHTVLCGSKKYPVRDPFFSMLKRSLSSFMNAFTASDWTMYPFSTQNAKDFYNLMDVYLDAAFFPLISDLSFKQEGHRLEIENHNDDWKLVYKGVVYNEMKGAMSSADQVLGRSLLKALYPDTTYANNSGGEPAVIPQLTYEQLKSFHAKHYHPSNAYFYTYGNLPLDKHLEFIDQRCLKEFSRIDPGTDVTPQPRWNKPKTRVSHYPISKTEDPSKKCQVCLAWLGPGINDAFEVLVLTLIEEILLGNTGSPLRKALIDSGIGTALSDATGFSADYRDTFFSCGLKDVSESDAEAIETLILDVLQGLTKEGIDTDLVDSAIHQIEFHRREVTNHPYPYGIKLLLSFSGNWFHGGDPVRAFRFDSDLEKIRSEVKKGRFFEIRLQRYFIDNTHRVLFKLLPDEKMEEKENRRTADELLKIKSGLTLEKIEKIKSDTEALKKLQETKEDLFVLPTLALEDISPKVQCVTEMPISTDAPAICYDQPTSGIFYFSAAAGIGMLDDRQVPLLPFFCYALTRCGTKLRDYSEMARRMDLYTGGVGLSTQARTRYADHSIDSGDSCIPFVSINGKCLLRNQEKLFDILKELLTVFDLSDTARLKRLLMEYRANLESSIVQSGHRMAISLAARSFSTAAFLNEIWHGVHQLQYIKRLSENLSDNALKEIADDLGALGGSIFSRDNLKIALIGEKQHLIDALSCVDDINRSLNLQPTDHPSFIPPAYEKDIMAPYEGWSTATAVSFVARTFTTVALGHPDAPVLSIISKLLKSLYLHREIREKGGAYGGFSLYSPEDGLFCLASYRDPHIVSTLNVFENALDFLQPGNFTQEDINEAVLQICSDIDRPDPPGPASRKAFIRKLLSLSDDSRLKFKQNLLTVDKNQVIQVTRRYFDPGKRSSHAVAVVSSEDRLKESNSMLSERPLSLFSI
jgi:Zn-dependent M16 (insulinase) family peptidase